MQTTGKKFECLFRNERDKILNHLDIAERWILSGKAVFLEEYLVQDLAFIGTPSSISVKLIQ